MNRTIINSVATQSKNQLKLFGYDNFFKNFIELYNNSKLPNTILLSGKKGSGKATFAYHFINYLLSKNENNKYSLEKFEINPNNKSYHNLCNNIHPNFFSTESKLNDENIKIDDVRNIIKFLSKSTYSRDIKIILIDNVENLNINSSNALLKALEEPSQNTFFFLINNNLNKILSTIKSRCIEFKFSFSQHKKNIILKNLISLYQDVPSIKNTEDILYIDTPGNILKYLLIFKEAKFDFFENKLSSILFLMDKYKKEKNPIYLNIISLLIESFYNDLSKKNARNLNIYFKNKFQLLKNISDTKKFSLDTNNLFISLKRTLKNEA